MTRSLQRPLWSFRHYLDSTIVEYNALVTTEKTMTVDCWGIQQSTRVASDLIQFIQYLL
jgi:hypothetical protein